MAQITGLDVTTTSDLDYYAFQVPAGTNGTMTAQVQSQGLSLLSPKLTVPMLIFFLPCLFVVIMGPAIMNIMHMH